MSAERVTAFKTLKAIPHSERVMGTNQDSEERMIIPEKVPLFLKRRKRQAPSNPPVPAVPTSTISAVPAGTGVPNATAVPANPTTIAPISSTGKLIS